MTREDQAGSFGRWLDQTPGSPPPEDVDSDVVEAVYALRPDLAPAPRLTADDILASVTRGPLADPSRTGRVTAGSDQGAEVVQFPARRVAAAPAEEVPTPAAPERRGLLWMWVGGTGGLGMALVAAATMLLVAMPILRSEQAAQKVASPAAPAATSVPAMEPAVVVSPAAGLEQSRSAAAQPSSGTIAAAPPPAAAPPAQVFEMEDGALYRDANVIPELQEQLELDAVADLDDAQVVTGGEAEAIAPARDLAAAAPGDNLDDLRAKATAKGRDSSAWRKGIDPDVLARMEAGIAQAEALRLTGNHAGAGDALAAVVQPPARAGQHLAALAAQAYLDAGNPQAAAGVATRGLGLSTSGSAERSALLVVYADALRRLGDTAGAADVYRQAR